MNKRISAAVMAAVMGASVVSAIPVQATGGQTENDTIVLRVCNWEEYIDEGGWEDDEVINLDSGDIFGENSMIQDFEQWYQDTYGKKVRVEYSTFGTNEELYSQLNLGNVYDLVCPSDYMIMKLLKENKLEPLSKDFFDTENENNYYVKGVSPYINGVFEENQIDGKPWVDYAAGYMWGITGMVYNPEEVTEEEASTWTILENPKFYRQVTIKDNVRDAYFPTLAILNRDQLLDPSFRNSANYEAQLSAIMNDTRKETIDEAEEKLKEIRANVYSFETDSGKADMVSGKVVANLQWSGDGVYALDQAEEDGFYLDWAVPEECTNLWFDGWVMLKNGIGQDAAKKQAAEAFINFLSRPDNAVRNMYYIGYTSAIAGGDSDVIFDYLDWTYGAEEDEEDTIEYPVGYFFSGDNSDEDYVITAPAEQAHRQLSAQYPSEEEISRSAVMLYFDDEGNKNINQMWINVRCFNLSMLSTTQWTVIVLIALAAVLLVLGVKYGDDVFRRKAPKGYEKDDHKN
ncbi:ABC transporter substrate-binding protein [Clostridiaceae bacterium Marseille-Q4145]|nr:ABC transporter substrate-binding protein [Clostridiaceae bacterium Marseille-Q4145]